MEFVHERIARTRCFSLLLGQESRVSVARIDQERAVSELRSRAFGFEFWERKAIHVVN